MKTTKGKLTLVAGRAVALDVVSDDPSSAVHQPTPAPSEFLIWAFGDVECVHLTPDGLEDSTYLFDEEGGDAVMARWRDYGNRLSIDYDHLATKGGRAGDGKAAGSFVPDLRADGLYATDIKWTPAAAEEISNGEWLYFSPVFTFDEEGRIISLVNLALTNVPATKNLRPLVAATALAAFHALSATKGETTMTDEEKAAEAKKAAADEEAKKCAAAAAAAGEPPPKGEGDDDDAPPSSKDGEEDLTEEEKALALAEYKAKKARAKAKSAEESKSAGAAAASAVQTDDEVEAAIEALPSKARGVVRAALESNKQLSGVSARLTKLETDTKAKAVRRIVAAAITDGKVAPGNKGMIARLSAMGTRDVEELKGFVETMPKIVHTEAATESAVEGKGGVAMLSATEKLVCERMGHDPVEYAKVAKRPVKYAAG